MNHPYQSIEFCRNTKSGGDRDYLLAACGPNIINIDLTSGLAISSWPKDATVDDALTDVESEIPEGPPEKRRKISETSEITGNVTLLQSVGNSGCFIAVTGEDKCLRVFEINNDHKIMQLSSRCMQKRPCAIAVSSDNKTIICGDKFGDVYAVPLFPTSDELEMPTPTPSTPASIDSTKSKGPAATLLTVHSGRNRKALENQKRVASQGKTKPASAFKQDLLIGHVSMLTDVAFITLSSTVAAEGKPRSYIISSDRDEHIRISRGPPQAHVIEGFCLGHKEFVSKLAVINEDILVSGGGDDDLFVWNWSKTNLLQKISIRAPLQAILEKSKGILTAGSAQRKIAVNGLWSISGLEPGSDAGGTDYSILLVSLEGIPALFSYECSKLINRWRQDGASIAPTEEPIIPCAMIPLAGNVLDVAIGRNIVVISLDNIHEPWSLDSARTEVAGAIRLAAFRPSRLNDDSFTWEPEEDMVEVIRAANNITSYKVKEGSAISNILYGVENLRKRGGADGVSEE